MLNYFEESIIKNSKLPVEWQSQSSLDELSAFLQLNWEQRAVFYDDGELKSRQQFLGFVGQKGILINANDVKLNITDYISIEVAKKNKALPFEIIPSVA